MAETLQLLGAGFGQIFNLTHMMYLFIGCFIGTIAGALPGLGATSGTSILLPLTFGMDPVSALVMLCGIYYGTMFGGSISAILLNIPGTSSAAITAIDGYELAKQGKAGKALGTATISSFIGGITSTIALAFLGIMLSRYALAFGAPEYFGMTLMGLALVTGLTGDYPIKGYLMLLVGLLLSCIGIDTIDCKQRFVFGAIYLMDGLNVVPVMVGLFGFSEIFFNLEKKFSHNEITAKGKTKFKFREMWPTVPEWKRIAGPVARGSVIGFLVGALPGAGATISTVLDYGIEKKICKHKDELGRGAIEGVAGPEASNNASTGGAMIPMLSLGIPGSATTAVMLTAMTMYGMKPGPNLYTASADIVWALIASMFVGNLVLVILNLVGVPFFATIVQKADKVLLPLVGVLCFIGAYSVNGSIFEVWVMLVSGVVGYVLRKLDYPMLPLVLGLILGYTTENSMRQGLILSAGEWSIFFTRPLACLFMIITIAIIIIPIILKFIKKKKVVEQ